MAFKFKLQKVLDYREQLEEEAKARLANAQQNLQRCREQLAALLNELADAEAKASAQALQAADWWLHDSYIKGLRQDRQALDLQERMLAQMAEEARRHLTACAIDRKALEKLKERHKIQYARDEQKREINFNDEIATIRHKAPAVEAAEVSAGAGVS